uniref:Uncharacterized protein n=1 Tax=Arundo donax TaxID=35708 RepID=A0A0A8YYW2_ARUDO
MKIAIPHNLLVQSTFLAHLEKQHVEQRYYQKASS